MKTRLIVLTLAVTAASPALAQIPVGTRVGDAPPTIPSGYDSGGFRLTKEAEATLAELAGTLREFNKTLVSVHGHSDASGGQAANVTLSVSVMPNSIVFMNRVNMRAPTRPTAIPLEMNFAPFATTIHRIR